MRASDGQHRRQIQAEPIADEVRREHKDTEGDPILLGERATNNMALVFHEFATNAAKYGALSNETGTVDIEWVADGGNLVLTWRESGGPAVTTPEKKGFGSALLNTTISGHGGTVETDWARDGIIARIVVPLSSLVH